MCVCVSVCVCGWLCGRNTGCSKYKLQGVVIPYTTVVTAKTGSRSGQVVFLVLVKRSKTSFKLS